MSTRPESQTGNNPSLGAIEPHSEGAGPQSRPSLKPLAYYWVRIPRAEGPAEWEPAQFIESLKETHGADEHGLWLLIGIGPEDPLERQITTPGASNRWEIGPELVPPKA